MPLMKPAITIIGAGMAGLACAHRLAGAGHKPLVLDKGRGIGGRMATRRVQLSGGEITFDHGAQYLTARDPAFVAALQALGPACARWDDGAAEAHLVGVPGMSGLPRALAAGLDVQLGQEVAAVHSTRNGWDLDVGQTRIETRRLILTVPAPQAAALLGSSHVLHSRIANVAMAPCLTLMAAFPSQAPRPFISCVDDDQPL